MRAVKLGRKALIGAPVAYHWAVSVGNTWYEIQGKGGNKRNSVVTSHGFAAASSAGALGGELVGETDATDSQINVWIEEWRSRNPDYNILLDNCQTFAYEFMDWLTNGNFSVSHRFNAAWENMPLKKGFKSFAREEDGNAIARYTTSEVRKSAGVASVSARSIHAQAQAVAGPGVGAWADASAFKVEAAYGNVVGVHIEPNVNTGAGIRNGNLDVHLLGFGGKIGADGIEVDTPLGGVNACSMM
jgi:hypothetical protein